MHTKLIFWKETGLPFLLKHSQSLAVVLFFLDQKSETGYFIAHLTLSDGALGVRRAHSGWKTLLNANATRHRNAFHHVKRKKGDKTSPRCHCKSGVTLYSPTSLQVFSFFLQSFRVSETSWRLATLWSVAACVERCHTCRRVTIRSKIKVQKKETVTNEMWYTYICIYIYLLFFFCTEAT